MYKQAPRHSIQEQQHDDVSMQCSTLHVSSASAHSGTECMGSCTKYAPSNGCMLQYARVNKA